VSVSNCRFSVDSDYNNAISGAGFSAGTFPQTMTNCTFEGYLSSSSLIFDGDVNATEGWTYSNVLFLNTKKPNNNGGIKIPRGTYIGCGFNNTGNLVTNKRVEFIGCTFTWDAYSLFSFSGTNYELARYINCTFKGGTSSAFYFSALTKGRVELLNNFFEYPNALSTSAGIIDGYWYNVTGGTLLLDGNRFKSNLAMKAVDAPSITSDAFQIIVKNNTLEENITYVVDQTQMQNFSNNTINGAIDPYDWATSVPSKGFYKLGKQIRNTNMLTSGFMGWICAKEGFLDTYSSWSASTNYTWNNRITVNGYVYYCTNRLGGKSTKIAPTFPTGPMYTTVSDTKGMNGWTSKSYAVGDIVLPSSSEGIYYYECTTAGNSATTEPVWDGKSSVTDGTVIWTKRLIIIWRLLGPAGAVFKQYGQIF
jgi:hypothetical protein